MAQWMVGKGAKNIVLVSRSGSSTGKVKELLDELTALGANILVRRCDVADRDSVGRLIASELVGMPEVRGVVHGAMVLRVSCSLYLYQRLALTLPGRAV
jgi:NADP-dependent 3-hydroxy acid dehydrogenase YdfG